MSTKVIQCKLCGRLFQSLGVDTCPICTQNLDESFKKINDYLYDHPEQSVTEISRGTDVPEKTIMHFLREGRLSIDGTASLECERCGKPITGGRFCIVCRGMLEKTLKNSVCRSSRQEETDTDHSLGKMHFNYRSK